MNPIYKMNLHDEIYIGLNDNTKVIRVPGGWIYITYQAGFDNHTSTFVPFDNEFQSTDQ